MSLTPCPHCDAFVPSFAASCPSCDASRPKLPRLATRVALAASFVTTLMACYGGPPPHDTLPDAPPATDVNGQSTSPDTTQPESSDTPTATS